MKTIALMFMLVTTQAFASEVCKFEETVNFTEAYKEIRRSEDLNKFTVLEKKMIHQAVGLQRWREDLTQEQALLDFMDIRENETLPGSLAGAIVYYSVKGKTIALVSHYPGDNEYGAFFEVKGSSFRVIAEIGDSFIECSK
jgi:hypothetical protein